MHLWLLFLGSSLLIGTVALFCERYRSQTMLSTVSFRIYFTSNKMSHVKAIVSHICHLNKHKLFSLIKKYYKCMCRHTSHSFHLNPICGLAYIPKTTRFLVSYYRPQTKLRKGNVFTCVCLTTEGEHISPGTIPSWDRTPLPTRIIPAGGHTPGTISPGPYPPATDI